MYNMGHIALFDQGQIRPESGKILCNYTTNTTWSSDASWANKVRWLMLLKISGGKKKSRLWASGSGQIVSTFAFAWFHDKAKGDYFAK